MLEKKWRAATINADGKKDFLIDEDADTKEEAERQAKKYAYATDRWVGAIEVTYNWPAEAERTLTPVTSADQQTELFEEEKK